MKRKGLETASHSAGRGERSHGSIVSRAILSRGVAARRSNGESKSKGGRSMDEVDEAKANLNEGGYESERETKRKRKEKGKLTEDAAMLSRFPVV